MCPITVKEVFEQSTQNSHKKSEINVFKPIIALWCKRWFTIMITTLCGVIQILYSTCECVWCRRIEMSHKIKLVTDRIDLLLIEVNGYRKSQLIYWLENSRFKTNVLGGSGINKVQACKKKNKIISNYKKQITNSMSEGFYVRKRQRFERNKIKTNFGKINKSTC